MHFFVRLMILTGKGRFTGNCFADWLFFSIFSWLLSVGRILYFLFIAMEKTVRNRRLSIFWLVLCCLAFPVLAQQKTWNVLWIGNSYTACNDLPGITRQLAEKAGVKLQNCEVLQGGQTLEGFVKDARLTDLLRQGGWDYVVIQEQSVKPALSTGEVASQVYPYARQLSELARQGSPDVQIVFYMTWGRKYGFKQQGFENYPLLHTYNGMQMRLIVSYLEMVYENSAWCAPVGMAWQRVRQERPGVELYEQDCSHPSLAGSYLAANVILTTFLRKPYEAVYSAGLSAGDAEYLQQTAQLVVLQNLGLLNITPVQ